MKKFYVEYQKGSKTSYSYLMFRSYADAIEELSTDPTIVLKKVVQLH